MANELRPTQRQFECFLAFARLGRHDLAARELAISIQRQKHNVGEYYRRIGALNGAQAAYLTWGPKE